MAAAMVRDVSVGEGRWTAVHVAPGCPKPTGMEAASKAGPPQRACTRAAAAWG